MGLFYQNEIESLHAIEKCIQFFIIDSVLEGINTINILIECRENEEVLALYSGGRYVLSQDYNVKYKILVSLPFNDDICKLQLIQNITQLQVSI